MSDLELIDLKLYNNLDDFSPQKMAILENELYKRKLVNLTTYKKIINVNDYETLAFNYFVDGILPYKEI